MSTKKIIYVGIDVDDKAFHGAGLYLTTGEFTQFRCKPDAGALLKKMQTVFKGKFEIHLCYEAGHLGYPLCRKLRSKGILCDIIAPSLIPKKSGKRVKTDRLDALKLAEYYAKDMLTPIYVPNEEDEEVRDLIRSRRFLVNERKRLKTHILSICKRYEINFQKETGAKSNWTVTHITWLKKRAKSLTRLTCRIDLELLISHYASVSDSIGQLEEVIEQLSKSEKYARFVSALITFRGIDTLTAMTLITEIGDIHRFKHPKQLMAYAGLDIAEYSSGGKENKRGITKTGNKHIRTILTESNQLVSIPPSISKRLKKIRESQPQNVIDIADRCMQRLYKKSTRMIFAGKIYNKVKTACAREMLGFIWEVLYAVA